MFHSGCTLGLTPGVPKICSGSTKILFQLFIFMTQMHVTFNRYLYSNLHTRKIKLVHTSITFVAHSRIGHEYKLMA